MDYPDDPTRHQYHAKEDKQEYYQVTDSGVSEDIEGLRCFDAEERV